MRQESQYPVEAVDALMMILKETAPNCNLDCLVEVCCPGYSILIKKKVTRKCPTRGIWEKNGLGFLYYDSIIVRN